jgi:hypothetical protein
MFHEIQSCVAFSLFREIWSVKDWQAGMVGFTAPCNMEWLLRSLQRLSSKLVQISRWNLLKNLIFASRSKPNFAYKPASLSCVLLMCIKTNEACANANNLKPAPTPTSWSLNHGTDTFKHITRLQKLNWQIFRNLFIVLSYKKHLEASTPTKKKQYKSMP